MHQIVRKPMLGLYSIPTVRPIFFPHRSRCIHLNTFHRACTLNHLRKVKYFWLIHSFLQLCVTFVPWVEQYVDTIFVVVRFCGCGIYFTSFHLYRPQTNWDVRWRYYLMAEGCLLFLVNLKMCFRILIVRASQIQSKIYNLSSV